MVDDPQEIMLDHLRALRRGQDSTHEKLDSLERRTTLIEKGLSGVRHEIALLHETYADHRYDYGTLVERIEKIEKRLDLVDTQ